MDVVDVSYTNAKGGQTARGRRLMAESGLSRLHRSLRIVFRSVRRTVCNATRNAASFLYFAGRRFYNDNCFQTASALTYTSLLAMVPLMTIGFAIFSAFPAFYRLRNEAQDILFSNLVPEVGIAVRDYLGSFMENAGQSTAFGVVGLAISAVLLLSTIEGAFGSIWRVTEPRPLLTRLLSFWALITLAPLLFGASLSVTHNLFAQMESGGMAHWYAPFAEFGPFLPMIFEFVGFSLMYVIIPNRVVHWADAICGGLTAAVLLETSKALFVLYVQAFPAYQTIYGALSIIPIFLLWLYIAWSTVLVGAVITAAAPEWRAGRITRSALHELDAAPRLAIALAVLKALLLATRGGEGLRRRALVESVRVGAVLVEGMLEVLRAKNWVARTTRDSWVVTRDLSESTIFDLLHDLGMGMGGDIRDMNGLDPVLVERCSLLFDHTNAAQSDILDVTLRDLFAAVHLPAPAPAPAGDDHRPFGEDPPVRLRPARSA